MRPIHVGFTGTAVGFANAIQFPDCSNQTAERRYSTHDGWFRFGEAAGSIPVGEVLYNKTFANTLFGFCDQYSGNAQGDSGGPFFDEQGHICGVVSNHEGPVPIVPVPPFPSLTSNHMAGVDSINTVNWLKTAKLPDGRGLLDKKGNFDGECVSYNALVNDYHFDAAEADADGDGIVDVCDECPDVFDPKQTFTNTDADGDGYDDFACDYCPGLKLRNQGQNRNYEAELAQAYPTAPGAPPITKPPLIGAGTQGIPFAIAKRLASFHPDACDPLVVPGTSITDSAAPLPADTAGPGVVKLPPIVDCDPTTGAPCNCPFGASCGWEVTPNELQTSIFRSDGAPPAGTHARFGYRFCDCDLSGTGLTTETLLGRAMCQSKGCTFEGDAYSDPPWLAITTETSGPWQSEATGLEFARDVEAPQLHSRWNFLALGVSLNGPVRAYDTSGGPMAAFADGTAFIETTGVLWTQLRELSGQSTLIGRKFARTYTSGDASASVVSEGGSGTHPVIDDWLVKVFCATCPQGISRIRVLLDDPAIYRAGREALEPVRTSTQEIRDLYSSVATGTLRYVEAAEPLSTLVRRTPSSAPILRGVALDSTITVSQMFESVDIDQLPTSRARVSIEGTPEIRGNEAMVLTAIGRRVLVLGGTSNGTPTGVPHDLGWMLDIDTNLWTSYPISASARPAHVLGATFRFEDAKVYLVDRKKGKKARLRSSLPESDPLTLGTLPASWKKYDRTWLVASPTGELVFVATRSNGAASTRTLLARFDFDDAGQVVFRGRAYANSTVLAAPIADNDGLTAIVPNAAGGKTILIPWSDFVSVPPGQAPRCPDPNADDDESD